MEYQLKKADNLDRNYGLLNQAQPDEHRQDRMPLVLTYSGSLPDVYIEF